MPLLDHFHAPLHPGRHWEGFHSRWASAIADALNLDLLPSDYFAEVQAHVGSRVEIDIATFESAPTESANRGDGGTATIPALAWAPPAAAFEMPAAFPDSMEVQVFSSVGGTTLVGAVELVSLGNKDRAETRRGFAAKCATYLQQGIGLIVADIVTSRRANLHNELVRLLELDDEFLLEPDPLYATAYRPVRRPDVEKIQVWTATLAVGQPLHILPLALDKGLCVPIDLDATYAEACRKLRLP
ncbi:MAG: DUF4058 domain-containing protein [Gemmataceae bacterium]|nr:DUF4058 domain-containing protein [Gemmataceae bacterium]